MLFNSFIFIGLVSITFLLYYIPKFSKYQVQILIIASLIFYSWHKPILVLLLLISVGINTLSSYYIAYPKDGFINRKMIAWFGVFSNIAILSFFKYAGLIADTISRESSLGEFLITIPLPVGISFFTFQGISLLMDVYKENYFVNREMISQSIWEHSKKTLFFISFFPQLVAGPIVKAHDFLPQITTKRLMEVNWEKCFKTIVLGYFLKMVVADNLKDFTFWITFPYFLSMGSISLLVMLLGFSCQIYADFAGYSLIAIGIAKLFGYNLLDNFNFPYISSSFREFWKRWHISLSTFLQEYLYIPLGGNRKGNFRTYINLMITMILGGLWHGAAWSYAVWGGFHGLLLASERFLAHRLSFKENLFIKIGKTLFVFTLVSFAWLLFKLPEFKNVIEYINAIFENQNKASDYSFVIRILIYSSIVFFYHLYYLLKLKYKENGFFLNHEYLIYGILLFLIVTNSGIPGSFIYFQF